jgi:hypothetical protein
MPLSTSSLALRERYELARRVRRLAGESRKAVVIRVLQYGVTRERLRARRSRQGGTCCTSQVTVLSIGGSCGAGLRRATAGLVCVICRVGTRVRCGCDQGDTKSCVCEPGVDVLL